MNVRFGDGYVEKVRGFVPLIVPNENYDPQQDDSEDKYKKLSLDEKIIKIDLFKKATGEMHNMVHTPTGLYDITNNTSTPYNLIDDESYEVPSVGHISSVVAFDEYIFTSYGTNICYWKTDTEYEREREEGQEELAPPNVRILEGTFEPEPREASSSYEVGDVVRPVGYNGYVYVCTQSGETSSSEDVDWQENLTVEFQDGTVKWRGVGSLELEGSSATTLTARCVELYKGFLFVANTKEGSEEHPYRLRWSQWQNPRLWHNNEDGSGLSNYVDVDDTEGQIVAIKRLNDTLYVYKERSIIAVTYTGGEDTTFTKEVVTTKAGLVSPEAIVELPHMHIFIGQDNVYIFDGNTCTPIGDPIKDWVYQSIKPENIDKIIGYYNEDSGDVTFSFCSTINEMNNCDKAITYNTSQRTWSAREMYLTAIGQYNQTGDRIIDSVEVPVDQEHSMIDSALFLKKKLLTMIGDENGSLYILNADVDSRLEDFEGYVVSKTHHMDAPDRIKRLMRIQFHIQNAPSDYNLYCQVGAFWNAEETHNDQITWTPRLYMNLKKPDPWYNHHVAPFVDVDLSARYFVIRFGTEHNAEYFKILGYTLYYQLRSDE